MVAEKEDVRATGSEKAKAVTLLLVSPDRDPLSQFASKLQEEEDVDLFWAESGQAALDRVAEGDIKLVVTDEHLGDMTGLELASKMLRIDPRVNCAAMSPLSPADFHEAGEGLGLMARLPVQPGREDAQVLLQHLRNIMGLTASE